MKLKIVTAPHPSLRQIANPVTKLDAKTKQLVKDLQKTLALKKDPPGVGLAATQVDHNRRLFAINLPADPNQDNSPTTLEVLVNPVMTKHSDQQTFGPDAKHPTLEGCLSIPNLYGPVPRFEWIEVEFEQVVNHELVATKRRFDWFGARVVQHELDHLNGILFTDYSLEYDLPVYTENAQGEFEEVDPTILEIF